MGVDESKSKLSSSKSHQLQQEEMGLYNRFSAGVRADIGKYTSYHGMAAAAHHFSRYGQ